MLLSIVFAWLTVIFAALCAFKYIARKSKNKKLNMAFRKVHIPFGIITLIFGLIHGLLAGNFPQAKLSEIEIAPVLFSLNWGTACFVVAVLLGVSYLLRKKLKKKWMFLHRILTVVMIGIIVIHIIDMGITVFDRISDGISSISENTVTQTEKDITTTSGDDDADEPINTTQKAETSSSTTTTTTANNKFSGAVLTDGTYQGSAQGYEGTINVSVTVEQGEVTDITILDENDTPNFFERAVSIINTIINGQTLKVDAVTGATFSSAGIVNAVYDALDNAVVSGTLDVTEFDLSSVRRGH